MVARKANWKASPVKLECPEKGNGIREAQEVVTLATRKNKQIAAVSDVQPRKGSVYERITTQRACPSAEVM